jgi:Tol biopolymer transport system component
MNKHTLFLTLTLCACAPSSEETEPATNTSTTTATTATTTTNTTTATTTSTATTETGETGTTDTLVLSGKLIGAECSWNCPLVLVDVDEGTQVTLTEEDADASAWSPSGEKVAYVSSGRVMVMNIDGSEKTLVASDAMHPAWSPDGSALVVTQYTAQGTAQVVMVTLADGASAVLASNGSRGSWSPDGASIAYTEPANGTMGFMEQDIYVLDLASDKVSYLTQGFDPRWSPDGERIAFARNDPNRVVDKSSESHYGPGMGAGIDIYVWDLASDTEEVLYLSDLSLAMWYMIGMDAIHDWIAGSEVLLVVDMTTRLGDDGYEIVSQGNYLLDTVTGESSGKVTELVNPSWHQ